MATQPITTEFTEDTASDGSLIHCLVLSGQWGQVKIDCVSLEWACRLDSALRQGAMDFRAVSP